MYNMASLHVWTMITRQIDSQDFIYMEINSGWLYISLPGTITVRINKFFGVFLSSIFFFMSDMIRIMADKGLAACFNLYMHLLLPVFVMQKNNIFALIIYTSDIMDKNFQGFLNNHFEKWSGFLSQFASNIFSAACIYTLIYDTDV
ncbi:hypothetical protein ACJX0J_039176, partial [Zea mays]